MSLIFAPILAAASAPAAITPEAAVAAIYSHYNGPIDASPPWDYPIYSRQMLELIAQWRQTAPTDEPDALSDGDWLCLCLQRCLCPSLTLSGCSIWVLGLRLAGLSCLLLWLRCTGIFCFWFGTWLLTRKAARSKTAWSW